MRGHVDDPSAAPDEPQAMSTMQPPLLASRSLGRGPLLSSRSLGRGHREDEAMDLNTEDVQKDKAPAKVVFIEFLSRR